MSLAEKLVSLRKQKGLTQMDLAERLNVSRQAVSRWEVGAAVPGTDNLKVLAELYGVRIDYLLNDDIGNFSERVQGEENILIGTDPVLKRVKYGQLVFCVVVIIIVASILIGFLIPRNQNQEQVVPMEDMYTVSDDDYSEGTFTIE